MDLKKYRRLAVLTGDRLGSFSSKTAAGVIRYRPDDVVAVIDWAHTGQDLESEIGWGKGIPVVATWAEAAKFKPDALLIGVAPMGGQLGDDLRGVGCDALSSGVSIISGLHTMLRDDPHMASLASSGAELLDVRDPGNFEIVATGLARQLPVKRVLTIGVDCVVGKMMTALELTFAARRASLDAEFVPTGQTGIMIAGWGLSVDRVISDFAAGAAEWLVQQVADKQICFVEGQGSIEHPGYSGVSLSLMHGSCPDAMIMCTRLDRTSHHGLSDSPTADIRRQIDLCEQLASCVHPARVVGISVNTAHMDEAQAREQIECMARQTGLPATDPVRYGADALLPAIRTAVGL
jgi:uncharacterized NAD-dependent epimerase/dehydratase family protein